MTDQPLTDHWMTGEGEPTSKMGNQYGNTSTTLHTIDSICRAIGLSAYRENPFCHKLTIKNA